MLQPKITNVLIFLVQLFGYLSIQMHRLYLNRHIRLLKKVVKFKVIVAFLPLHLFLPGSSPVPHFNIYWKHATRSLINIWSRSTKFTDIHDWCTEAMLFSNVTLKLSSPLHRMAYCFIFYLWESLEKWQKFGYW